MGKKMQIINKTNRKVQLFLDVGKRQVCCRGEAHDFHKSEAKFSEKIVYDGNSEVFYVQRSQTPISIDFH